MRHATHTLLSALKAASGLFLLFALVGESTTAAAQSISLPITFEESINYELRDFEPGGVDGPTSTIIVDPTDATNMVVQTVRPASAVCYAGTTVAEGVGFDQAIPFTMDETTMSVRVWSPEAGALVLFKVEEQGNPALNVETYTYTTVAGGWETMVFDFADPKPNTNPIQIGGNYNKATIFFDFQCGNVPPTTLPAADRTYYWDDVAFGGEPVSGSSTALILTGVVDGPLTGGIPKAVEFYVAEDIADLSVFGLGSANNADGTNGVEFAFPMGPASAGDFLYLASEEVAFADFFGFAPTFTSGAANINGDDSIELFYDPNGVVEAAPADVPATTVVVDVFGEVGVDGTGMAWEYLDGWAYRANATGPDGSTFDISNWTFSGINALDGETTNAGAATPFPVGSYSTMMGGGDQVSLPITFEESIDYALRDFEPGGVDGPTSTIIVDPTDATNMVVQTVRPASAVCYAGTTVAEGVGFDQAIPFTMDETTMSVRVWSPEAGALVLFKVEEQGNPALNVETYTYTTVAGGWETMVFDFADPKPNTNPIQIGGNYNKATIFFDFQCGNVPPTTLPAADRTYYWDDVAFGSGTGGDLARLQVIHNSPDPAAAVVDIYVNDALFLDDVPFRGASPFQDVPAGVDLTVDIVDGAATDNSAPVFTETYNLPENTTAQLIATGVVGTGFEANPDGVSTAFTLLASLDAQEAAMDPGKVALRVVHGAPDAPTVDVRTGGAVLVDDATYTDVTGYLPVDPLAYTLDITTADGSATVAQFTADLSGAAGGAVTVLASGFLTPENDNDGPAFGLLAVFPNGTSALLPVLTEDFAGYLLGANEVPPVTTDAAGFVNVSLAGNEVTIEGRFAGLSSDYLFSHFHRAPAGGNGPVIQALSPTIGDDNRSGVFSETVTLEDVDIVALRAGEIYVNVHSETNSGGELRTQLVMNPDTAEVTFPQARNIGPGYAVTVQGVVTRTAGAFAYVQADGAALAIRQPAGAFFDDVADGTITSGTEVSLTGTLSEFRQLLQINDADLVSYEVLGTAEVPEPQEVTLAELEANGEAYEAELVRVGGVQFSSTGTFAAATTYSITDASSSTGAVSARVPNAADTSVDGTAIPAQANVTAIVGQFNSSDPAAGYQLLLIEEDDIQNSVASEIDPNGAVVSLTVANPIRGMATVRFSAGTSSTASVSLYDMLGRRVAMLADGPFSGAQTVSLDATSLSAGVYVLRLQTEDLALTETVTVVR